MSIEDPGHGFSHLDEDGAARMVNIGAKPVCHRVAVAEGFLQCLPETVAALRSQSLPKGDVLAVARVAGILAAKRTQDLIPLCHQLPLDAVTVDFDIEANGVRIRAEASVTARTGIEMEALTAVSVAALTLYDMCKAVDKGMAIGGIRLVSKTKTPLA
jgi:cyclic pyranopterin monophosphate synthase